MPGGRPFEEVGSVKGNAGGGGRVINFKDRVAGYGFVSSYTHGLKKAESLRQRMGTRDVAGGAATVPGFRG